MPQVAKYGPWIWSEEHKRHYCWSYDEHDRPLHCHWGGPVPAAETPAEPSNTDDKEQNDPTKPRTVSSLADATQIYNNTLQSPAVTAQSVATTYTHYSQTPNSGQGYNTVGSQNTGASYSTYSPQFNVPYGQYGSQNQQGYAPGGSSAYQGNTPLYGASSLAKYKAAEQQASWAGFNANQSSTGGRSRRYITTGPDNHETETLDPKYRRVAVVSHQSFFVPGRVFKMLWIEPAGIVNPGQTRGSTHFSITQVRFGEHAYSEIRRFVVIRNCGTFSQCIPVQTYKRRGATKPGINVQAHGIIYTGNTVPNLLPGEAITKQAIRVVPKDDETLDPESRINYAKPYAVEHNVKVLEVGVVADDHQHLLEGYFQNAILNGA